MKLFRMIKVFTILTSLVLVINCGGGGGEASSVTVTLSPAGATGYPGTVIKATFSAAITEPTSWNTNFTLVVKDDTTNLCEDLVIYSELVATCANDPLTAGTTYVLTVTGVTDANGDEIEATTLEFTVSALPSVTMTKGTVTTITDGSGEITLTFTFDEALTSIPTVTMTALTDGVEDPTVAACTTTDNLVFTCDVTGLQGCRTVADYQIVVTDPVGELLTANFNSSDDEFDWEGVKTVAEMISTTAGNCWRQYDTTGTISIQSGGTLQFKIPSTVAFKSASINKSSGTENIATNLYLASSTISTGIWSIIISSLGTGANTAVTGAGLAEGANIFMSIGDGPGNPNAGATGDLATWETAPMYICFVGYDFTSGIGPYKAFVKINESDEWTQLTTSNLECGSNCTNVQTQILDQDVEVGDDGYMIMSGAYESDATTIINVGFARFNANAVTGTSADCPAISYESE